MFKYSLFAVIHWETLSNSILAIDISAVMFGAVSNNVVSSAKNKNWKILDDLYMSLIYMRKSRSPNIEPCGTPLVICDCAEKDLVI